MSFLQHSIESEEQFLEPIHRDLLVRVFVLAPGSFQVVCFEFRLVRREPQNGLDLAADAV